MRKLNFVDDSSRPFFILPLLKFLTYLFSTLILGILLSAATSTAANAAATTITGKISGVPSGSWGLSWAEKKVDGEWIRIDGSVDKFDGALGKYTAKIGEENGSLVRIWVIMSNQPGSTYVLGGQEFTVSRTSEVKNLSAGAINLRLSIAGVKQKIACSTSWVSLTSEDFPSNKGYTPNVTFKDGVGNLSLPAGKTYQISGYCGKSKQIALSVEVTSTLKNVEIELPEPNVTGSVSGISDSSSAYGVVQRKGTGTCGGITDIWTTVSGQLLTASGEFANWLDPGTYRIKFIPNNDLLSAQNKTPTNFVNTYSESFTVEEGVPVAVPTVTMSSTPNFIYTLGPTSSVVGGYVQILQICGDSTSSPAFDQTNQNIGTDGVIKNYLLPGKYWVILSPGDIPGGYVQSESQIFEITEENSVYRGSLNLKRPNLKVIVSPKENAMNGYAEIWDNATNSYLPRKDTFLNTNGEFSLYLEPGNYKFVIHPGLESPLANRTTVKEFIKTDAEQILNVTLSRGNISGRVTPVNKIKDGVVYAEEKIDDLKGFQGTGITANIDDNGDYFMALPEGTYRLWASSNSNSFIRSPSAEFTVETNDLVKNIEIRSANITGLVSPANKAADGFVSVIFDKKELWDSSYDYWARIKSDGTYELALPPGDYKLKATGPGAYPSYFGIETEQFNLGGTPLEKLLTLVEGNVTGTVFPIAKSKGGWIEFQKLISGIWVFANQGSIDSSTGKYSIYLPNGSYRAIVNPNWQAEGVFKLTSEPFEVDGTVNFNFTLPATNFSVAVTPASSAKGIGAVIEKLESQGNFQQYSWTRVNQSGNIESFLPEGRYRLQLYPNGNQYVQTTSKVFAIPTSPDYPIPTTIALSTPNLTGTITPGADVAYGQVCVQKMDPNMIDYFYVTSCKGLDKTGKYAFQVENGTYRIVATPASVLYNRTQVNIPDLIWDSPYVQTTSDIFSIQDDTQKIDLELSTGNLSGVINGSDTTKSAGSWIQVLNVAGAYPMWTNYQTRVSSDGTYALQLPIGKYKLQVRPSSEITDVVATESGEFEIKTGINKIWSFDLDSPNVTGVITPIEKSVNGWLTAEQITCNCGWRGWSGAPGIATSSQIAADGSYGIKLEDGLSRVIAYPRKDATGVTRTTSQTFTVSGGAHQDISFELSEGNIRGVVSSMEKSVGGWVRVEQKFGDYWNWTNYGTQVLQDGSFRMQVENGTYRLIVTPGWRATGVVETPSAEFTIDEAHPSKEVNVTLLAPNLRGSVTNVAPAVDVSNLPPNRDLASIAVAWANISQKVGNNFQWTSKYFTIYADGSYSIYLPDGTYKIHVYYIDSNLIHDLTNVSTTEFTISGSDNTFNFALTGTNLRGTIRPATASAWGWVCAQYKDGDYFTSSNCSNIRPDGTYAMNVSDGEYRIVAYPQWNGLGFAQVISTETVVVAGVTVSTLDANLQTTNVKLTIKDLDGKPNFNGWVTVKDLDDNYVDTAGKGWISQLGKIDFRLAPGSYKLEINPGSNARGVKRVLQITVLATEDYVDDSIVLSAGNVQGAIKNSSGTNIPCAFITATALGQPEVKAVSKKDGSFDLNLASGTGSPISWTIQVVDPSSGDIGESVISLTAAETIDNLLISIAPPPAP